jgi:alkanesulfonate monooxygenase SsuD/methylene tetrahydromethanopterin reductase-like flavin-dependent oxidoreductase (luciferase family)
MEQMGARTPSPLTTLEEVITAVTRLLAGETVTMEGREVQLRDVTLDQPPAGPPPVLAGVRGPKSLALAGRVAGGVVLAEPASPTYVRLALEQAGHPDPFHVAVFAPLCVDRDRDTARRTMAPWLADVLEDPNAGVLAMPFADELIARHRDKGLDGIMSMPDDWWLEIGPVGTLDDAAAHLAALEEAGAHSIGLFPAPEVEIGRAQVDDVLALCRR